MAKIMSRFLLRTIASVQVLGICFIAWVGVCRSYTNVFVRQFDLLLIVTLLLVVMCVGFFMKFRHEWSTRMLWEWVFISMVWFGGWIFPRLLFPGSWGTALAALVLLAPFVWRDLWVQTAAYMIGCAGAGIFLAAYMPMGALWILWIGLVVYDVFAKRLFTQLQAFLALVRNRRGVFAWMPVLSEAKSLVLTTHVVLPLALIVQVTGRSPVQGAFLGVALFIGAWYAMVRTAEDKTAFMVPWSAVWMSGVYLLILLVERL